MARWQDFEIQYLRDHYNEPNYALALALGRTVKSVEVKASRLDLTGPYKAWSEEEILEIRRLHGFLSNKEIAEMIGRTEGQVEAIVTRTALKDAPFQGSEYKYRCKWGRYASGQINSIPYGRVVMAKILGRPLSTTEIVHHINCDETDDRAENLHICTRAEHLWIHRRLNKYLARKFSEKKDALSQVKTMIASGEIRWNGGGYDYV